MNFITFNHVMSEPAPHDSASTMVNVTVRVPEDLLEEIDRFARQTHRNRSLVTRMALEGVLHEQLPEHVH